MAPSVIAVAEADGDAIPLKNGLTAISHAPLDRPDKEALITPLPNPCLQATADHQLKQVECPVRNPGPGEVLLHVKATGVCG